MRQLRCAGDRDDKRRLVHQPSQGYLGRRISSRPTEGIQDLHDAQVLADGFGLEARQSLAIVVCTELRVFVNQATEEPSVYRTIRHKADSQLAAEGQNALFHRAMHQVILALDSRQRADGVGAADSVGIHLAKSPMENLAFLD